VARWEGLEGVVDFILVAGADCAVVHYLAEAVACFLGCDFGDVGLQTVRKWGRRPPMSHFKNTWKTAAVMRE
jgi:hypothetical protein